ncbi:putative nucleic acid-binding protein [Salinibacter ruber]|nr:putative nucleic acid-binding protein [Salinibacter ruber]
MIVVADTGPIIALAKLDRIDLLWVFEADILVPPRVRRELPASRTPKTFGPRNRSGERKRRKCPAPNHSPEVI